MTAISFDTAPSDHRYKNQHEPESVPGLFEAILKETRKDDAPVPDYATVEKAEPPRRERHDADRSETDQHSEEQEREDEIARALEDKERERRELEHPEDRERPQGPQKTEPVRENEAENVPSTPEQPVETERNKPRAAESQKSDQTKDPEQDVTAAQFATNEPKEVPQSGNGTATAAAAAAAAAAHSIPGSGTPGTASDSVVHQAAGKAAAIQADSRSKGPNPPRSAANPAIPVVSAVNGENITISDVRETLLSGARVTVSGPGGIPASLQGLTASTTVAALAEATANQENEGGSKSGPAVANLMSDGKSARKNAGNSAGNASQTNTFGAAVKTAAAPSAVPAAQSADPSPLLVPAPGVNPTADPTMLGSPASANGSPLPASTAGIATGAMSTSLTHEAAARPAGYAPAPGEQLAVEIHRGLNAGKDSIKIRMNPAELGSIKVEMQLADDGVLRAVVTAEKPETLEMLQRDSRELERALQNAGVRTDSESFSFKGQNGDRREALAEEQRARGNTPEEEAKNSNEEPTSGADQNGGTLHDGSINISV